MFDTHKLNEVGFNTIGAFKTNIAKAIQENLQFLPEGREKALFMTHIEQAMFWGTKAIAANPACHSEVIKYGE